MSRFRHIAVVPARKGSKGIPGKNLALFGLTAALIRAAGFFARTIVTSDDEAMLHRARSEGFDTRRRPKVLASDSASIKSAFEDVVAHADVHAEDYLWLLFIPLVYKNSDDFCAAYEIIEKEAPPSLCSFIPARTHPYTCWRIDPAARRICHFIENDAFNRQDFPPAWENYNYLCCVRAGEVSRHNSNLIAEDTRPVLLDRETAGKMVELDEPGDFTVWRTRHPQLFAAWRRTLPADAALPGLNET